MRLLLAAVAACFIAQPLHAQETTMTKPQVLSFERVFASPDLNGPSPRAAMLSPDGRYLTLLRNRPDDKERYDLWGYDRDRGEWTMLVDSKKIGSGRALSEDEKMQRERARVGGLTGIISYQWAHDGKSILVPLDGDLYLAGLDGKITRLTDTEESELNPALSPKGAYVSFVRDRQLWIGPVNDGAGTGAVPITPQEGKAIRWGEAEFVAQEEMNRLTGFWWSPDEKRIVVQRTDETPVGIVTRAAIGATGTKVYEQSYPAAGTNNAIVQLFVMDPDGGDRVQVDLGSNEDIYLARVDWAPDGKTIYVQRQNRDQSVLDMLKVDPLTGKSTVIFTEKAAANYWINLSNNYKFLDDGSLIWWSERDGFGHLYRFAGGKWTQLTKGDWVVTKLVGVDQKSGQVTFTGNKDGVLQSQIYALDLKTPGHIRQLSEADYFNSASMDDNGRTMLVTRNAPDQPLQNYIADASGKRLAWIEENKLDANHPYAPYVASHRMPTYGSIKADDGKTDLHYSMITPEMEPGKRYPVFFSHYGGPHVQVVANTWTGALAQAVVDKGYIWFEIDNRGSDNRGVAFEQPIYRAMGGVEVRDQKSGAEYLKTLDFVDPAKIAVYGWSYGGYMTLKMLEADPGLYAAGISGAPVTKWELYDTHYTERYMGDPRQVVQAYDKASAIPDADKITDPLLLIHGMADDNVVFENSTALIAKLQGDAVPFEMMLYPGYTHRVAGEKISPHLWNTIFAFLKEHGVTPPE